MKTMLFILLLMPSLVLATGNHNRNHHTHETNVTNVTETTVINNQYSVDGVAMSLAFSGISFDQNVTELQYGFGGGWYENDLGHNSSGLAFGMGQRICFDDGDCGIINATIGKEEGGGTGFSFGITF